MRISRYQVEKGSDFLRCSGSNVNDGLDRKVEVGRLDAKAQKDVPVMERAEIMNRFNADGQGCVCTSVV